MVVICQENVTDHKPDTILEKFERREFYKNSKLITELRSSTTSLDDKFLFSTLKTDNKHLIKYQSGSLLGDYRKHNQLTGKKNVIEISNKENRINIRSESSSTSSESDSGSSHPCEQLQIKTPSEESDIEFDLITDLNLNNELNRYSDLTLIDKHGLANNDNLSLVNRSNLLLNLSSDLEEEDDEYVSRRETIVFKCKDDDDDENREIINETESKKSSLSKPILGTTSISSANSLSIAAEVASLSSVTSNYSQFDFNNLNRFSPSPPPPQPSTKDHKPNKSNSSFTTFFLSTFGGQKKQQSQNSLNSVNYQTPSPNSSNSTFDLITSKFFKASNKTSATLTQQTPPKSKSGNLPNLNSPSSSFNSVTNSSNTVSDNLSLKSNHSFNNLSNSSVSSDLKVPSSVLIFENRPSNLPAKSQQEALKHKQEYEKMVEIAKKKGKHLTMFSFLVKKVHKSFKIKLLFN